MRGAGGPYPAACGDGSGRLLPDTGPFLLFPSRVCPVVSDHRGEGPYPALGGSLGCQGVRSPVSVQPLLPPRCLRLQALIGVDVCEVGAGLSGAGVLGKGDHLSGSSGLPGSCEAGPEGRSPQTGDPGRLAEERRVALVPDIPSHHLGPGSPMAKRPLSGRESVPPGPSYVQVSVPSPGGRGLVLTGCPAAVQVPPSVLSTFTTLLWPGGQLFLFLESCLVPSPVRLRGLGLWPSWAGCEPLSQLLALSGLCLPM